jgi:polyhydroxyalkanoate synthesis regulator phasin
MSFESFRGYVQLASGLGELTRARATEAAQGLLSLSGVAATTGKLTVQVSALAEELLAAATANREHLTTLVRHEVEAAVTRLGLVAAEKLEESQAEVSRLRAEVAALRPTSRPSTTGNAVRKTATKKTGPVVRKTAAKQTAAKRAGTAVRKVAVNKTAAKKSAAKTPAVGRSAVTTRRKPAGT